MRLTPKQIEEFSADGDVLVNGKPVVTATEPSAPATKKKSQWVFTVQRDDFGRIKTITADEK